MCNLFGYAEVMPVSYSNTIKNKYIEKMKEKNFIISTINKKEEVWPAFKGILENNLKEG